MSCAKAFEKYIFSVRCYSTPWKSQAMGLQTCLTPSDGCATRSSHRILRLYLCTCCLLLQVFLWCQAPSMEASAKVHQEKINLVKTGEGRKREQVNTSAIRCSQKKQVDKLNVTISILNDFISILSRVCHLHMLNYLHFCSSYLKPSPRETPDKPTTEGCVTKAENTQESY